MDDKITQKELLDIWRNSAEPNFIKWLDKNPKILDKVEIKTLTESSKTDINKE